MGFCLNVNRYEDDWTIVPQEKKTPHGVEMVEIHRKFLTVTEKPNDNGGVDKIPMFGPPCIVFKRKKWAKAAFKLVRTRRNGINWFTLHSGMIESEGFVGNGDKVSSCNRISMEGRLIAQHVNNHFMTKMLDLLSQEAPKKIPREAAKRAVGGKGKVITSDKVCQKQNPYRNSYL